MENLNKISGDLENKPVKKVENVGNEFFEQAEKYWHIDDLLTNSSTPDVNYESCPYSVMRDIFIQKINELSK